MLENERVLDALGRVAETPKQLPKKSVEAFRVLISRGGMMTGRQIATELRIEHQNVYRLLQPLISRELIMESTLNNRELRSIL